MAQNVAACRTNRGEDDRGHNGDEDPLEDGAHRTLSLFPAPSTKYSSPIVVTVIPPGWQSGKPLILNSILHYLGVGIRCEGIAKGFCRTGGRTGAAGGDLERWVDGTEVEEVVRFGRGICKSLNFALKRRILEKRTSLSA